MRQKGMDFPRFIKWYKDKTTYTKEEFDELLSNELQHFEKMYKTVSKYKITERGLTNLFFFEASYSLSELKTLLEIMELMPLEAIYMVRNFRKREAFPVVDKNFNTIEEYKQMKKYHDVDQIDLPSKANQYIFKQYHKKAINFATVNATLLKLKLNKDPKYAFSLKAYNKYVKAYEEIDPEYKNDMLSFILFSNKLGNKGHEVLNTFIDNELSKEFVYNLYETSHEEYKRFELALNKIYTLLNKEEKDYNNLKIYYENFDHKNKYVVYDNRVAFHKQEKTLAKKLKRRKLLEKFNEEN